MKQTIFINKVLNNESADINELAGFLVEYIQTLDHPEESKLLRSLPHIISLITSNQFDIIEIIRKYCINVNLPIYTVMDLKTNQILKIYV